jgi:integrase
MDISVVDVQRRLGHRKPDTTLRVYAHEWKHREARRSQIGQQLGRLFDERKALPAPAAREARLALPPARAHR